MPGIGIVTNPNSRRNRRFPEQMRRLGYILGRDDVYEMTNQPQDVGRVAEEFMENDIDILALNGGDGTNHVTLTKFIEVYGDKPLPKIALLRGGTMNTISNAVGASGRPGKILLNLVERYYTGQKFDITERDMLKITDGETTRYGFIFGNGVIASFLEVYYEDKNPSPAVAAKVLARTLASAMVNGTTVDRVFAPFNAEMTLDGQVHAMREYVCIGIATIEQIGLGFRPFFRCEEDEGGFHIMAATGKPLEIAAQLPNIRFGRSTESNGIQNYFAKVATLKSDKPILYTIDGDMHRAEDGFLKLEAGPRLQIILA